MRDGLYQVTHGSVTSAFVVEDGRITQQTPTLQADGVGAQVRRVDTFYRVMLTGSRDYTDQAQVRRDLTATLAKWGCRPDQVVVVNGMARGLDTAGRAAAIELGMRVEDHPVSGADWDRYGKSAGHRRNAVMVASTARRPAARRGVIAYPVGESRGTRGAMALAEGTPELKGRVWNRTDPPAVAKTDTAAEVDISEFRGKYRFLSSYYPKPVIYEGVRYPSREHAFHAAKTSDPDLRLQIAACGSPAEAKRLGQRVPLREDWTAVRVGVMTELIAAQVADDAFLADRLLDTGNATLREGNTWHDQIWGDCRCGRPACAAPGENRLGRAWMQVRDQLRQSDEAVAGRLGKPA